MLSFLPLLQSRLSPEQMPKNWEFALAGTGTIGTAIFAPHERSSRMANMTAAFIVGMLVPIGHMDGARAER